MAYTRSPTSGATRSPLANAVNAGSTTTSRVTTNAGNLKRRVPRAIDATG